MLFLKWSVSVILIIFFMASTLYPQTHVAEIRAYLLPKVNIDINQSFIFPATGFKKVISSHY